MKTRIFLFMLVLLFGARVSASDFKIGELCYTVVGDDFVSVSYDGDKMSLVDAIALRPHIDNNIDIDMVAYFELFQENWDKYHNVSKTIEVPSKVEYEGKSYFVTAVEDNGFATAADLYKVILPETVNSIGKRAFEGSTIREVSLPSKLLLIDEYAFEYSALKKIEIPTGIRSINEGAFANCGNLDLVKFEPDCRLSMIPTGCFEESSLREINLPESIKVLGNRAFYGSILESFSSSDLDEIGEACFSFCTFKEFNCKKAREIKKEAFYHCYLPELEIDTQVLGFNSLNCGRSGMTRIVRFLNKNVPVGLELAFGYDYHATAAVISVPDGWKWGNNELKDEWFPLTFNFRYDTIDEFGITFMAKPNPNSYVYLDSKEEIYVKKGSELIIGWKADSMDSYEVRHNGEIVDPERLSECTVEGLEHNIFYQVPKFEDSTRIYMTSTAAVNDVIAETDDSFDVYSVSGHLVGRGMTIAEIDNLSKGTYVLKSENSVRKIHR